MLESYSSRENDEFRKGAYISSEKEKTKEKEETKENEEQVVKDKEEEEKTNISPPLTQELAKQEDKKNKEVIEQEITLKREQRWEKTVGDMVQTLLARDNSELLDESDSRISNPEYEGIMNQLRSIKTKYSIRETVLFMKWLSKDKYLAYKNGLTENEDLSNQEIWENGLIDKAFNARKAEEQSRISPEDQKRWKFLELFSKREEIVKEREQEYKKILESDDEQKIDKLILIQDIQEEKLKNVLWGINIKELISKIFTNIDPNNFDAKGRIKRKSDFLYKIQLIGRYYYGHTAIGVDGIYGQWTHAVLLSLREDKDLAIDHDTLDEIIAKQPDYQSSKNLKNQIQVKYKENQEKSYIKENRRKENITTKGASSLTEISQKTEGNTSLQDSLNGLDIASCIPRDVYYKELFSFIEKYFDKESRVMTEVLVTNIMNNVVNENTKEIYGRRAESNQYKELLKQYSEIIRKNIFDGITKSALNTITKVLGNFWITIIGEKILKDSSWAEFIQLLTDEGDEYYYHPKTGEIKTNKLFWIEEKDRIQLSPSKQETIMRIASYDDFVGQASNVDAYIPYDRPLTEEILLKWLKENIAERIHYTIWPLENAIIKSHIDKNVYGKAVINNIKGYFPPEKKEYTKAEDTLYYNTLYPFLCTIEKTNVNDIDYLRKLNEITNFLNYTTNKPSDTVAKNVSWTNGDIEKSETSPKNILATINMMNHEGGNKKSREEKTMPLHLFSQWISLEDNDFFSIDHKKIDFIIENFDNNKILTKINQSWGKGYNVLCEKIIKIQEEDELEQIRKNFF